MNPIDANKRMRAFTLVELLIVVAIIAILASIAVPNFLEAQTRARAARVQGDLRTIAIGLESYRVDNGAYPPTPLASLVSRAWRLKRLTSPVAYLSALPDEVFSDAETREPYPYWSPDLNDAMKFSTMYYFLPEKNKKGQWALFSRGPDMDYEAAIEEGGDGLMMHYDPTNGTISNGDIIRFSM